MTRKIWSYQKKVVTLQAEISLKALTQQTKRTKHYLNTLCNAK